MSSAFASGEPDSSSLSGSFEFDLDEVFSGDTKLDAVQEALAIEFLRRSKQIQLERLQCISESALLASEQVQDIRLDLLEKGPEITTEAVLFDLFIGFILDSNISGLIIKKFVNGVAKNMVRRNMLLMAQDRNTSRLLLRELKGGARWRDSRLARSMENAEKAFRADLSAKQYLKAADSWSRFAVSATSPAVVKEVTALAKTAAKAAPKKFVTTPSKVDGDTPGVELVGSVYEFISTSRLVAAFQYERMETLIRIGSMTGDDARRFLRIAEFEETPASLKHLRDRCKLLFEAIIWAGLYKFDNPSVVAANVDWKYGLKNIDRRLVSYWITRFGEDVTSWVNTPEFMSYKERDVNKIADWGEERRLNQELQIARYFTQLLNDLPQKLSDANALISTYDPATNYKSSASE